MFEISPCLLAGVEWVPAAQGSEPESVLRGAARVGGVTLEMHAFRAFSPFRLGWSPSLAWEDDRSAFGPGVMWRAAATRTAVADSDAGRGWFPPPADLSADEADWESRWLLVSALLEPHGARWIPARIGPWFYHVVGVPASLPPSGPALRASAAQRRPDLPARPGVARIPVHLSGSRLDLMQVRVREIGGRMSPADPGASPALSTLLSLVRTLGGSPVSGDWGDGRWLSVLIPADTVSWDVDVRALAMSLGDGLDPARSRWLLRRHDRRPDAFDRRVLEDVAEAVRDRRLARRAGGAWLTRSMDAGMARLGGARDAQEVRNRLFRALSFPVLFGVGRDAAGRFWLRRSPVMERTFVFAESAACQPSPDFLHLASELPAGVLASPSSTREYHEIAQPERPGAVPPWVAGLPPMLDGRLERFLFDGGAEG